MIDVRLYNNESFSWNSGIFILERKLFSDTDYNSFFSNIVCPLIFSWRFLDQSIRLASPLGAWNYWSSALVLVFNVMELQRGLKSRDNGTRGSHVIFKFIVFCIDLEQLKHHYYTRSKPSDVKYSKCDL